MSEQQQFQQRTGPRAAAEDELRLQRQVEQNRSSDSSFEDLLDQIDAVIDANPEGYVRTFVQRGGQ